MASATAEDYLKVHVTYDEPDNIGGESMWAKYTGVHGEVEIANIPFFTEEFTMGDVVRVDFGDGESLPEITGVVRRSGNVTVGVRFKDVPEDQYLRAVEEALQEFGCKAERAVDCFYAFCIQEEQADALYAHLCDTGLVAD